MTKHFFHFFLSAFVRGSCHWGELEAQRRQAVRSERDAAKPAESQVSVLEESQVEESQLPQSQNLEDTQVLGESQVVEGTQTSY